MDDHQGSDFHSVLSAVHASLRPKTYLEIGTAKGESLARAECASIAIDPQFTLEVDVIGSKPSCMLFSMGSDQFFTDYDPTSLFNGPIDFAFLDGMHYFEFLLRDFLNVEQSCKKNSVIMMHDCIPTDLHVARRDPNDTSMADVSSHPDWWAGDLWRAVRILKKYRPDLRIIALDAPPTGLIAITNLDPSNSTLARDYWKAVEEAYAWELSENLLEEYVKNIDLQSTKLMMDFGTLSRYFWI